LSSTKELGLGLGFANAYKKGPAVKPAPALFALLVLILMPLDYHPDELNGSSQTLGTVSRPMTPRGYNLAGHGDGGITQYCIMQGSAFVADALCNITLGF